MTTSEAINLLASKVCDCGRPKRRRTAFCPRCYAALPQELKERLWDRIGKGFEAAYEAARAFLKG